MNGLDIKRISAVVMAAGQSERMGQNKLLMPFRGQSLLAHTLGLVDKLGFGERVLVTSDEIVRAVQIPLGFTVAINDSPQDGQASSIKLGLRVASLDYYIFFQADMPFLDKDTVLALVSEIEDGKIIVPYAGDKPASPVIFHKSFRSELLKITGDKGGCVLIAEHKPYCKAVIFEDIRVFMDVDTPDEYEKLNS